MSFLAQAKKATPQAPVVTIVGFAGSGKSSLAGLFPNPIFIQAENASTVFETMADELQPAFMPLLPKANKQKGVKPSYVLLEQLRELITQEHEFKTVVIDTITALNVMFEQEVVEFDDREVNNIGEAAGGFNKGYLVVAGLHAKLLMACEHLRKRGMTVVFLAHTGIVKMKNRPDVGAEYTAFTLDMNDKSRQLYVGNSDAVLYLKARDFVSGNEENRKGQTTKFGRVS